MFPLIILMLTQIPPKTLPPVPSARQLAWHQMEFYAFVHFGMNTFTDREWGQGTEPESLFNPSHLDCRQWVRAFKAAGMKGVIITAKHHDGFCLWPSKYTEHSVKNSPWKGDVLRELSDACKEYGLKLGVYVSPWDRNQPVYGDSPKYNEYFRNQLREVLTHYGPIFEVWFDGANGEGPNGKRQVYDWPGYIKVVRECQPNAVIFSDAGPDVRWVGNEDGYAAATNWCMLNRDQFYPGGPGSEQLPMGHEDGTHWVPAECDVSIRPGWFYHAGEDARVKTVPELLDIYYASVGQNGSFLLNVPADKRGLIADVDVARLAAFRHALDETFKTDLARGAKATASSARKGFPASNATDQSDQSYWAAKDGVTEATLTLDMRKPQTFNRIVLQESIALGQRVKSFTIEYYKGGKWQTLADGTTIGHKRIFRTKTTTAQKVRLVIHDARACPTISTFALYAAPPTVDIEGTTDFIDSTMVTLLSDFPGATIFYSADGSDATKGSVKYTGPFRLTKSGTVRVVVYYHNVGSLSTAMQKFTRYEKADLRPAIVFVRAPDEGLRYAYYEGGWQHLGDMTKHTPVLVKTTPDFSIRVRKRDENFGLRFTGFINVPTDGIYTFYTASDDGSRLSIGDKLVVDNDGLHGMVEKSGVIGLRAGFHPITVDYFNLSGGLGLEVFYKGPDVWKQPIPPSALFR